MLKKGNLSCPCDTLCGHRDTLWQTQGHRLCASFLFAYTVVRLCSVLPYLCYTTSYHSNWNCVNNNCIQGGVCCNLATTLGLQPSLLNRSSSCPLCSPLQGASSHRELRMRQRRPPSWFDSRGMFHTGSARFPLLARHHPNLPVLCSCGRGTGRDPSIALRRGERFRLRVPDWAEACSLSISTTDRGKASGSKPLSLCTGKRRTIRDYAVNLGVGHNLLTKLHPHPLKGS